MFKYLRDCNNTKSQQNLFAASETVEFVEKKCFIENNFTHDPMSTKG